MTMRSHAIETITHGRYLVDAPRHRAASDCPMVVGFHGYGENAETHLEQLRLIPGSGSWLLVAVQSLHRFYARNEQVVGSWMTRQDRELMIRDNVAYVDRVVTALREEHGESGRLAYVGFSQGVGMAFRAAVHGADGAAAVVALGGDIPPELHAAAPGRFPAALLARGRGDTWYTAEKLDADVTFLRLAGVAVEPLTFEGGHEWTDCFRETAGRFLAARFGAA